MSATLRELIRPAASAGPRNDERYVVWNLCCGERR